MRCDPNQDPFYFGTTIASTANREGVADRMAAPAGPKPLAGALARLTSGRRGLVSPRPGCGWDPCAGACPARARPTAAASPVPRTVGGHSLIARPQRRAPWYSARATSGATAPQDVCGAAPRGGPLPRALPSAHAPACRRREALQSGKKSTSPLLGVVCLLTKGCLICSLTEASYSFPQFETIMPQ